MAIELSDHQRKAIEDMRNGCILCGDTGSGKSRTALGYYYYKECGGEDDWDGSYLTMTDAKDLYIITTAQKRDKKEWELEMAPFLLSTKEDTNLYDNIVVVDSWNNISKYKNVRDAFFIFDEQRLVGSGAWVKAFLQIAKFNNWVLLSATPGDSYMDYIPVFIANGFFKNRTEFIREHVVYRQYAKFPQIDRILNTRRLDRLRDAILIDMPVERKTVQHHENIHVPYDMLQYKQIGRDRWNPFTQEPIVNAAELCYIWRKIVNSDYSRAREVLKIVEARKKVIVFYNFDYELDILKNIDYGEDVEVAEWNGHKHQLIPNSNKWVYLVQYTAGCEGWNCIKTDTIVFYSQNYSYKVMVQAAGRIDRLNTPFIDLYYYHLKSSAPIDRAISVALKGKKKFNEGRFIKKIDNRIAA